jgi:hypothetical protein
MPFAFPLQQWLRDLASVLRYTYTVPVLLKINWNITVFETRAEFFLAGIQVQ